MSRNSSWGLGETLVWLLGCLLVAISVLLWGNEKPTATCGACDETMILDDHAFRWPDRCPNCGEDVKLTGVFR